MRFTILKKQLLLPDGCGGRRPFAAVGVQPFPRPKSTGVKPERQIGNAPTLESYLPVVNLVVTAFA